MRCACLLLVVFGYSGTLRAQGPIDTLPVFPAWIVLRSASIDFCFQDTVNLSAPVRRYMTRHEEAYGILSEIFEPKLPSRLRYYVWTDRTLAYRLLGKPLGFASPARCVCNIHPRQTRGHEMTHVFSHWAWGTPPRKKTRFVNEGLATAFDLSMRQAGVGVRDSLMAAGYRSILDLWEGDWQARETVLYPAAAAFIIHLRDNLTAAEFQELVKEQTIGHMRKVLGKKRLRKLVSDFDRIIGLE